MRIKTLATALAASFLLIGCADSDNGGSGDKADSIIPGDWELDGVIVTEADDDGTVSVTQGQNLIAVLSSNPSTGYEWQVTRTDRRFGYPQVEFYPRSRWGRWQQRHRASDLEHQQAIPDHGQSPGDARVPPSVGRRGGTGRKIAVLHRRRPGARDAGH